MMGDEGAGARSALVDWEEFYATFRRPGFIPGYEIQNHLGGGAFGEVYKARKSSIGKAYAVKFLRLDGGGQSDAAERELEQVRLFASIDHPNLVTIEDIGVAHGVPYLIMGYAGEDTLARRLERGELDREQGLRTFVQTCRGVLALHDRRLAHFDLKPSNVFLKGDVARVGDYGLAKLLVDGRQTLSFGRGTPQYMAPEMLRNRGDHRADVYSLGVILYEILAGRLPCAAESGSGLAVREEDEPPEFPPDFPLALRAPVERCLRLDPEERYESVHALLEELGQSARQGDSVSFDWGDGYAPLGPGRLEGAPETTPAAAEEADGAAARPKDELRLAAAELARGAVGVARGVFSGVVERIQPGSSGSQEPGAEPSGLGELGSSEREGRGAGEALGDEVVAVSGLGDDDGPQEGRRGGAARGRFAAALRELSDPPAPAASAGAIASPLSIGGGLVPSGGSERGTVPVPPRAEGGVLGSIASSLVLGAEILGALVSGPVVMVLRSSGRLTDHLLRRVPGVLGRLARFGAFLVLLAALGGLVSFVLLFGLLVYR